MSVNQKTIKAPVAISGIGLHSGCKVNVTLKPAEANTGINFIRVDLPDQPVIKADPSNIHADSGRLRCTSIGHGDVVINTVEHLMSALCGLQINNVIVEIDANELPGLDGSSLDFLKALKKVGIVEQKAGLEYFEVKEPIGVAHNESSIMIFPDKEFRVSYSLNYNHPFLKAQFYSTVVDENTFENEIAPCRTFCLESESNELMAKGLGKGANYTNTLVVGADGVKENKTRFVDEFVRHKVLDLIGDLYLFGIPIRGHIFAVKSGHVLNFELLKKIHKQKEEYQSKGVIQPFHLEGRREIMIGDILKILPHRYPFLLVDRVIEIEHGKRAVGIKNVTINDNFFQGHFPSRPIMPGVLMVEAMAQTGGLAVLTDEQHQGQLAFFLAADNVKFRKVVSPGDQLYLDVVIIKNKAKVAQIHAEAKVNGEVVAEADLMFSFIDGDYLT